MKGLMQKFPLTLDLVLRRALDLGASVEVVSRNAAGLDRRSWADVGRRAVRVRGVLDTLGVPPGAPVATFAWNGHRHVELMLGVPCAGRVVHPVNATAAAGTGGGPDEARRRPGAVHRRVAHARSLRWPTGCR